MRTACTGMQAGLALEERSSSGFSRAMHAGSFLRAMNVNMWQCLHRIMRPAEVMPADARPRDVFVCRQYVGRLKAVVAC